MALHIIIFDLGKVIKKHQQTFYLILLFTFCLNTQSQNEASKWYFGHKAALDFMTNPPGILTDNAGNYTLEGCASVADGAGNLLFYSNGKELWNKNHVYMANSSFLLGDVSSTQSSLIVKKPGSSSLYYVFTTSVFGTTPLAYSIVDMSLAAGLGSVTVLNTILTDSVTEKLCGTMHCNGIDVWILAHKANSSDFHAYLLTSSGVNPSPVISSIGSPHSPIGTPSPTNSGVYIGQMKVSPTSKKVALAIPSPVKAIEIFDFNNTSGVVSNSLSIPLNNLSYYTEFSPDGNKLYGSEDLSIGTFFSYNILQWDLCAGSNTAIAQSQITVGTTSNFVGQMQLGQYGRIYITEPPQQWLATINNPNVQGASCNFTPNSVSIGTVHCELGLPNFLGSTFREKAKASHSKTCGTASFSYTPPIYCANASYSVNSVQWSFGDPASGTSNTSSLDNPTHVYPTNGTYTAQLTVQYDCYSDVIQQVVTIDGYPNLSLSGRQNICINESTTLTASGAASYSWSPGAITPSISLSPSVTAIYTVTGTGTNTACSSSKVLTVSVLPCTNLFENKITESVFLIYPNPANTQVTVETNSDGNVTFFNTLGQKVLTHTIHRGKNKLTISDLPLGIYSVIGKTGNSDVVLRFVRE